MEARPNATKEDEAARTPSCRISAPVGACIIVEESPDVEPDAPMTPELSIYDPNDPDARDIWLKMSGVTSQVVLGSRRVIKLCSYSRDEDTQSPKPRDKSADGQRFRL